MQWATPYFIRTFIVTSSHLGYLHLSVPGEKKKTRERIKNNVHVLTSSMNSRAVAIAVSAVSMIRSHRDLGPPAYGSKSFARYDFYIRNIKIFERKNMEVKTASPSARMFTNALTNIYPRR